ncbi:MAG TPA: helix-turn-helix domain-containing protein [Chloroflexota bacterium]
MDHVIDLDRRQRKRQALHQQLLDSAEQLFLSRGVGKTTVEDIAEAADVARQTVFNHFPYKEALALELASDGVQKVAYQAHVLLEAGSPALEVLEQVSRWLLDTAIEQGELAVVVARELMHPDPDRALRAREKLPLTQMFEAILMQAREEHAARRDLPIGIVADRISGVLIAVLSRVTALNEEELRRELAVCFDIVFNGITERRI